MQVDANWCDEPTFTSFRAGPGRGEEGGEGAGSGRGRTSGGLAFYKFSYNLNLNSKFLTFNFFKV